MSSACRMFQTGPTGRCRRVNGGFARPGLPHQLLHAAAGPTHDRHLEAPAESLAAVADSSADVWRFFGMPGCSGVGVLLQVYPGVPGRTPPQRLPPLGS